MPILNSAELTQINALAQAVPYAWLLEMEIPTDPIVRYRFTNQTHAMLFGTDGLGVDLEYIPFPFTVTGIRRDSNGGQYNVVIAASNVRRQIMAAIETYDGLIGQPVRVMLVHKALLGTGTPLIDIHGQIITHRATEQDIEFEVGEENLYRSNFPQLRISPTHCAHPYGGILCGFDTTRSGANQTCTKVIEGPDGCREHGEEEEAAGEENRHPLRFGGFPGVPRNRGGGS